MTNENEQQRTGLYRLFAEDGQLLYVGISHNPDERFAYHRRRVNSLGRIANRTIDWFASREEARQAEVEAIRTERPRYNTLDAAERHDSPGLDMLGSQDWVNFREMARRLQTGEFGRPLSHQRVAALAETDPNWPFRRDQWRRVGNTWLFPWEPLADYFRNRKPRPGTRTDLIDKPSRKGDSLHAVARKHFVDEPFTTAQLVEMSGLSNPTVLMHVNSLIQRGLVKEIGRVPNASGRGPSFRLLVAVPTNT